MNSKVLTLLFAVLITSMLSCKKGKDDLPPVIGPPTYINVVNASADTINVYQNGTRITDASSYYPNGSLGYVGIVSGLHNYQVKKIGAADALVNVPLTLDSAKAYSLFVAEGANKLFLLKDTLNTVELVTDSLVKYKKAGIRFVNASPERIFDITIGSSFNYKNRGFQSATSFTVVNSGANTLTIYPAGSLTPVVSGPITLTSGYIYTLFSKGTVNGTGDRAFGVRLIRNR